jgi:uncharacterized damage-inducible protein DinB
MPGFPAPKDDETAQLLAFLDFQRSLLRLSAYGLSDEQAGASPSASDLCIGGLVKHLTAVEHNWTDLLVGQPRRPDTDEGAYQRGFQFEPGETLTDAFAAYEEAARRTDDAVRGLSMDTPIPIPKDVPWFPKDVDTWSVRWVVLHLIEETARHAGHADIIRESLDGATWLPLLSAADNWDLSPWIQPWRPAEPAESA